MFYYNDIIYNIFYICIINYLPFIFFLKAYIDNLSKDTKKSLTDKLTIPWIIWCLLLSLFSAFGTYYTGKQIFIDGYNEKITDNTTIFWYQAFILSKIPELLDTIFVILRSKHLGFIQPYHHWVTMTICCYATFLSCDVFIIFFFMNYFVHFFMYAYFALYCFFGKSLKIFGNFVNYIQTLQMLLAIILAFYFYKNNNYANCNYKPSEDEINKLFFFGIFMYFSYFILFINLYFERSNRIKN